MEKYIVVRANTNSDWDNVSVVIVELTEDLKNIVREVKKAVDKVKDIQSFNKLSVFDSVGDFFVDDEGVFDNLDECVVTEYVNFDKLHFPESSLETNMLNGSKYGVQIVSFGKHTGEEFWSDYIKWETILNNEEIKTI